MFSFFCIFTYKLIILKAKFFDLQVSLFTEKYLKLGLLGKAHLLISDDNEWSKDIKTRVN